MGSKGFKVLVGVLVAVIVVLGGLLVAKNLLPKREEPMRRRLRKPETKATAQDVIAEPTPRSRARRTFPDRHRQSWHREL